MRRWPLLTLLICGASLAPSPSPAETGCSGVIARYRAVQESDVATGNVNRSVYAQIKREIEEADKACAAGQDAQATAMIRASQKRHGYSSSL